MRASRLVSILLLLQTHGRMTAGALAEETGVSVRTVYRDLDALAAAGVPVTSEPGPGGGYELVGGYCTRLTGLTPAEAGALFLAGVPGPAAELGLGALLAAAELKVLAALPPGPRASAALARERFLLDAPGWFRDNDRPPHLSTVAVAVWEQRPLVLCYQGSNGEVERAVDPLGLVLKGGVWYLVARAGGRVRTYRVSRIAALAVAPGWFERPPSFDLTAHWKAAMDGFLEGLSTERATLRLSPRGVGLLPHLLDTWAARAAVASATLPDAVGWVRVDIPIESVEVAADQVLSFGTEAEVLAPAELRRRLAAIGKALAERYAEG